MQTKQPRNAVKLEQAMTTIQMLKSELAALVKYKEQLNGAHTLSNNLADRGFVLNEVDVTDQKIEQILGLLYQAAVLGECLLKKQKQSKPVRAQRASLNAMLRAFDEQAASGVSYDAALGVQSLGQWMRGRLCR